jgi:hypothetical protein
MIYAPWLLCWLWLLTVAGLASLAGGSSGSQRGDQQMPEGRYGSACTAGENVIGDLRIEDRGRRNRR